MAYNGIERKVKHDHAPLSYDEVRNFEFEPGVKPIDIQEVNDIFFDYKDLILVVDKIDDLTLLVTEFDYPDRMIVEVFNVDAFDLAVSLGIKNIVFNINIKDKYVADWVISNSIPAVTFSAHSLDSNLRAYENAVKLKESGVVSLAYSSNDDLFIKNNIGITVSAVYTDYWSLKNRTTNILGGRTTY